MKVSKPLVIIAVLGLSFGAYGLGSGFGKRNPQETKPTHQMIGGLAVEASSLEIGEVWETREYSFDLSIHNRNSEETLINDFGLPCSCIGIEPHSLLIPAGQTRKVHLDLDLTKRAPWEIHVSERQLRFEVIPIFQGNDKRQSWLIQGKILTRVTLDTKFLEFGEQAIHNGPKVSRKIEAITHVPTQGLKVIANPPLASVEVVSLPDQENHFQLQVTLNTNMEPGPFKFELYVFVVNPNGEWEQGYILPVEGTMCLEVRALPTRLLMGGRPVGTVAEATVVLQIPQGENWEIDHIETDSAAINVEPIKPSTSSPNSRFCVTFRITKPGDQEGTVKFFIRKEKREPTLISMDVSCYGISNEKAFERQERQVEKSQP